MKKQGFTILLILLISMISTKALADASGSCGDNVTWTYVEATQTLTISGSGAMYDYSSTRSPWYNYREMIKKAVIEEGVTSIGNYAFYDCKRLTSVTIGNSVTSIGDDAFFQCSGLTSVTIPNSVTSIGDRAFLGCTGLTSVTIGNSVTRIGGMAFYNCKRLTSVTIGSSVNYIGSEAFRHCYRLSNINCLNHVPPTTEGDTFICDSKDNVISIYDIYNYAILNVPNGYRDVYNAAYDWRNFKNIKDGSESGGQGGANVNFTIQMGTIGYTRQQVKMGTSHTIYIGSFGNNRVNAVFFNGVDVTNSVVNGNYTTPEIKGESVLSVTYESNASALSAPEMDNLKVMGYNGEISVDNIDSASSVSVYTVDGKLIDSIPSAIGTARLQVPSDQLYIVKVGNRTFKLAM